MQKFVIHGGKKLGGTIDIKGYKNAATPIIAASLLTNKECIIKNIPRIGDVFRMVEILESMGVEISWLAPNTLRIKAENINPEKIPANLFEKMRVSVLFVGPLLARFQKIKIPHPGGDKIGLRPILTHIQALKDFGVKVEEKEGFYHFEAPENLEGKQIILKEFSVSATEILMMVASLAKGKTRIELTAAEPQVQDLGIMLQKMGVNIEGIGTHAITIEGRNDLNGAEFSICPDPLEVGTFLIAFAVTGGNGKIKNVNPEHLVSFLDKMKEIGVNFEVSDNIILVKPSNNFKATKIQVLPYPGFPTDLQPQISVLLTQAQGRSLIHDPLYENRFQYLHELRKMVADMNYFCFRCHRERTK